MILSLALWTRFEFIAVVFVILVVGRTLELRLYHYFTFSHPYFFATRL